MNPDWVLIDENEFVHLESGLRYTTICGLTFDSDDVDRVRFDLGRHNHTQRCQNCNDQALKIDSGGVQ